MVKKMFENTCYVVIYLDKKGQLTSKCISNYWQVRRFSKIHVVKFVQAYTLKCDFYDQ